MKVFKQLRYCTKLDESHHTEYAMRTTTVDVHVGFSEMTLNCEVAVHMSENKKVEYCPRGKLLSKSLSS